MMTELVLVHRFCHPRVLQTIHVDMKRSLPKCNLRMAQGTKCQHAIKNYMRKVKLKYQHVPPSTPSIGQYHGIIVTLWYAINTALHLAIPLLNYPYNIIL